MTVVPVRKPDFPKGTLHNLHCVCLKGRRLIGLALSIAILAALAASGCSRDAAAPAALDGVDEISASESLKGQATPCNLLASEEVELSINAAIGEKIQPGRPILAGMVMCSLAGGTGDEGRIEDSGGSSNIGDAARAVSALGYNGSVASWGLTGRGARPLYQEYRRISERSLDAVEVSRREAVWDPELRTLVVVGPGERILGIRLTVRRLPLAPNQDQATYIRETAKALAERAVRRMDASYAHKVLP